MKAQKHRAEILVVDRKLGRDPIMDPLLEACVRGVAVTAGSAAVKSDPGRIKSCPRLVSQAIRFLLSSANAAGGAFFLRLGVTWRLPMKSGCAFSRYLASVASSG